MTNFWHNRSVVGFASDAEIIWPQDAEKTRI
jgi:hypothetical protein